MARVSDVQPEAKPRRRSAKPTNRPARTAAQCLLDTLKKLGTTRSTTQWIQASGIDPRAFFEARTVLMPSLVIKDQTGYRLKNPRGKNDLP